MRLACLPAWRILVGWCQQPQGFQPTDTRLPNPCPTGSITAELVQADASLNSNEIAKCLSSLTINLDADCNVNIAAPAADNSFIDAMWSSDSGSYKQMKLCPLASPKIALGADVADYQAAILKALNSYAYGLKADNSIAKTSGATIAYGPGVVTVTIGGNTLVYAIRDATAATASKIGDSTNLVAATAAGLATAGLSEGTSYRNSTNVGQDCPSGSYGLPLDDFKLCPLCPAGTVGDGNGCTACSAGSASAVVGFNGTCSACLAGTYAADGERWWAVPLACLHGCLFVSKLALQLPM